MTICFSMSFQLARVLFVFLAVATISLLSGCGDRGEDRRKKDNVSDVEVAGPGPTTHELSVLIWEDYVSPEVIQNFESTHGATVKLTEAANSEEFKQKLSEAPSAFDLVVTDERTMSELVLLRLLRPFQPEVLAAFKEVDQRLSPPENTAEQYSVPYLWGLTVLAGRSDVISGMVPSWSQIWREDLRVGLIDEPFDLIWFGLVALGHEPESATEAHIDEVVAKLAERFPDITSAMFDPISGLDALEAGELDLLITYNGDGLLRADQNSSVDILIPIEGAPIWIDGFALTRDSPNPELANRFISYMSLPEFSAKNASFLHYATPVLTAQAHVEERLLKTPELYPDPAVMEKCRFVRFPKGLERYVHQAVVRLVSGGRSRATAAGNGNPETGLVEERGERNFATED